MAASNAPQPNTGITWAVGPQLPTTQQDERGQYVPGYEVQFTLSNGHTDTVFVPVASYTKDKVRAIIAGKAAEIVAISQLTGTVGQG